VDSAAVVYLGELSIIRDGKIVEIWLFFHDAGYLVDRRSPPDR
jgi:hypothetical protein